MRETGADEVGGADDDDERTLSALWRGFPECIDSDTELQLSTWRTPSWRNVGGVIEGVATAAPLNLVGEPDVCEMIVESPEISTAEMIVEGPEITKAVASNEMTYENEGCVTSGVEHQVRGPFVRKRRRFGRSS